MLQLGASAAEFAGPPALSAQVSVAVPVYPLVELTETVEIAELPRLIAAGCVVDREKDAELELPEEFAMNTFPCEPEE